jgi:hypothetical protein
MWQTNFIDVMYPLLFRRLLSIKKHEEIRKITVVIGKPTEDPIPLVHATAEPRMFRLKDEKLETPDDGSPQYRPFNIIRANEPLTPLYDSPLNATPIMPTSKINQGKFFKSNVDIRYPESTPTNVAPLPRKAADYEAQEVVVVGGIPGLKAPKNYINPYVLGMNEKSSSPKYKG